MQLRQHTLKIYRNKTLIEKNLKIAIIVKFFLHYDHIILQ